MNNLEKNNMSNILTAQEVSLICKIKIGKAYQIIRNLNLELEKKGFLTIRGRISKEYLLERLGIKESA